MYHAASAFHASGMVGYSPPAWFGHRPWQKRDTPLLLGSVVTYDSSGGCARERLCDSCMRACNTGGCKDQVVKLWHSTLQFVGTAARTSDQTRSSSLERNSGHSFKGMDFYHSDVRHGFVTTQASSKVGRICVQKLAQVGSCSLTKLGPDATPQGSRQTIL